MKYLTIGSDPEVLLRNRKTHQIVSAIPFVPEGKDAPRDLGNGFKVLHDNVLIEFNIPAASSSKEFLANLREGFRRIHKVVGIEFELVPQASHVFNPKFLQDRDAKVFGCDREFCAYERRSCLPPDCHTNLRSCGAHIHIGRTDYENPDSDVLMHPISKGRTTQLMDLFVGLALTSIDKDRTSGARKQLYGRAGRHRPTRYGVEYRTPPNYWLRSPKLAELVYDLTTHAVSIENSGQADQILASVSLDQVVAAINSNRKDMCAKLLNQIPMPKNLMKRIHSFKKALPNSVNKAWKV